MYIVKCCNHVLAVNTAGWLIGDGGWRNVERYRDGNL